MKVRVEMQNSYSRAVTLEKPECVRPPCPEGMEGSLRTES